MRSALRMQERHVLVGGFKEMLDHVQGRLEFLRELLVLLIAPGIRQARHLRVQAGYPFAQVAVELLEMVGESPQFQGINNGL